MVTFDGVTLSEILPQVEFVDISIGSPSIETVTRDMPGRPGSFYVRNRYGMRNIVLTLSLELPDELFRSAARNTLFAWCSKTEPKWLQLEQVPGRHLIAVCTSLPDFSVRDWWEDIQITFTAIDPFFIDDTEKSANVGEPLTITGDTNALAVIRQTQIESAPNPKWIMDAGAFLQLDTLINGDIVIDFDAGYIENDGTPVLSQLTLDSRFFIFPPGVHTLSGDGGAGGTVYWRERWL